MGPHGEREKSLTPVGFEPMDLEQNHCYARAIMIIFECFSACLQRQVMRT